MLPAAAARLRLRAGVALLRLAVRILDPTDCYYIIPRSKLPGWVDDYIAYLEATDYRDGGRDDGRTQGG